MQSKIQLRTAMWNNLAGSIRCPFCEEAAEAEEGAIVCRRGHRFDMAKKGQLFMLRRPASGGYDDELFAARQRVIRAGFYGPMHEALEPLLPEHGLVVDAGCGEGSHLIMLRDRKTFSGIGIDNAKPGIEQAAAADSRLMWVTGDITSMPLNDQAVDVLLNVFSPASYQEFKRVTGEDGLVVKAVPGPRYLQEIRQLTGEKSHSSQEVEEGFFTAFPNGTVQHLQADWRVPPERTADVMRMTPLTWKHRGMLNETEGPDKLTLDVRLLLSKPL
ncbi:methyltransferase domain-containing protein [Alkalicoccus luteus]|uniref:Methyltransferase domain-containing protein n=1 Tax=Alkalicoccus luteus TaxID=1237094 RepID=A0A969PUE9_9BACI|nr:methyltransferase domain-containing protein [Alkalicoccus luteus]NJP37714.1 methyltransferase domain-containing protein [Alkalicoccus luteus]